MTSNIEDILARLEEDFNEDTDSSDCETNHVSLQEKIPGLPSKNLCNLIVAYRYLNSNKDLAIASMHELSKRRLEGNDFNYESYIEESLASLPTVDFSTPDLRGLIAQINKIGVKIV